MNRRDTDSIQRQQRKATKEEEINRLLEDIAARLRGEPPSEETLRRIYQQLITEGKLDPERLHRSWENLTEHLRSLRRSKEQEAEEPPQAVREQREDYRTNAPMEVRTLKDILTEFLDIALPRMLDRGYALKPAKSEGYEHGRHEAAYYVDQSIRTHVLNGLFAVTRLMGYLAREGITTLSDTYCRRLLALFATHDLHKDEEVEKGTRGEFDIALSEIEEEMRALSIQEFVTTTPAEHRLAMIHTPSPKVGDLATSNVPPETSRLIAWVRLADALASMQSAQEYRSAQNRLNEVLARQLRTNPQAGRRFYFHELDDYRGLSTLLIHRATAAVLEKRYGLFPLLFFPNGVLYVGAAQVKFDDSEVLRKDIAEALFTGIQESLAPKARTIAAGAIRPAQSVKVDKYAYLFTDRKNLLQALADFAGRKGEKTVLTRRFSDRLSRKQQSTPKEAELQRALHDFCETYAIDLQDEKAPVFSENWACVWKFAEGVESVAKALVGKERALDWLFTEFQTPPAIQQSIREHFKELTDGLVADHCLVIAYHYLRNGSFGPEKRPVNKVEHAAVILNELVNQLDAALKDFDTAERRLEFVNDELGLQSDLTRYLSGYLNFSFAFGRGVSVTLPLYSKERSRSHARLCVICRREVPSEMSDRTIKTPIAEQNALVFSNFVLPAEKVKGQMVWCPMCYLEFMLRKLMGLGYVEKAKVESSDRLYLYLLPDYSFTPDFWEFAEEVLEPFVNVTALKLRWHYGEENGDTLPRLWIEHGGRVDRKTTERVQTLFRQEAKRLEKVNEKIGHPYREGFGERLHVPKLEKLESPNYQLLVYENSVGKNPRYQKLAPTRSELWAKATYAGCLLHLLLGVRVYITDKPYLPMSRPDEMTAAVKLDAPHPVLRGILGGKAKVSLADLQAGLIDVLSAAWEVNAALAGGSGNLDKQVAGVLECVNTSPLAGATFYKERERDDRPIYDIFKQACNILLRKKGGETMELVERLSERSLDLFLPSAKREGKAHRYETVFRTGVEVVKRNPKVSDEELVARVGGAIVKRLERISGGAVPLYGEDLNTAALEFACLIVKNLFRERCKGSAARLTHEENALADAIYFLTDQKIRQRWADYKAKRAAAGEPVEEVEEATVVG
jgi:hypothetical protein